MRTVKRRHFILLSFLFFGYNLWAQFDINGKIQLYPSGIVIVKKWHGYEPQTFTKTKTRQDGSLEIKGLIPYTGRLFLELDKGQIIPMFSDGTDITFTTNLNKLGDIQYRKSKINQDFLRVFSHEQRASKIEILSYLLHVYKPSDSFYASLKGEIDHLANTTIDTADISPVLKYNLELDRFLEDIKNKFSKKSDTELAKKIRQEIADRFKNDGEFLESSGNFYFLQQFYIGLGNAIYDGENKKRINQDLDKLLNEVGYETERGQLMLAGFLNFFKTYDMQDNFDYFMSRVHELTCDILPELEDKIKVYKDTQLGQTAPEIHFNESAYGKYRKLSEIPSGYKILMFWSSNCPHCQKELIAINKRYKELRKKDREFVGISLDSDKKQLAPYVKDVKWYNYCDFKGYASPPAKSYAIVGTPTFFLLDRNNKILFIANRFEDVMDKLN